MSDKEPTVKGITWKDVNILDTLINQVRYEFPNGIGEKSFGLAVLEKFKDYQYDIEESASEDLEEEILCRWEDDPHTLWPKCPYSDFKNIAHHFAEWQREQLMKDAVECTWGSQATSPFMGDFPNIECGDKVKIIIVKEK